MSTIRSMSPGVDISKSNPIPLGIGLLLRKDNRENCQLW